MQTGTKESGERIIVMIRVRPLIETESVEKRCLAIDKNNIVIDTRTDIKSFTFDYVADEKVNQEEIFAQAGKPLADACLKGYNATIFAYGQTGAGKTYTIQGPSMDQPTVEKIGSLEMRGLMPRIFDYLFSQVTKYKEEDISAEYIMKCSYLEIYQETIIDLLDQNSEGMHIREDIKRGVYVEGLIEENIENIEDLFDILKRGAVNRHVGSTAMNKESSRSHSVMTLSIESKTKRAGVLNIRSSRFHIIDLAGSERQKTTDTAGERLKEAGMINKSLSALGNVINSLVDISQGKSRHVHYRDSKLTFLLKDSLGGNSKTVIIANVSQSAASAGETLSTLNFAKRAKLIKNKAVINEDTTGTVLLLQQEIKRLKAEIAQLKTRCTDLSEDRKSSQPSSRSATPVGEKEGRMQELLKSTLDLRTSDVKVYEQLLHEKDQALDVMKKCVKRYQHEKGRDKMILKLKEAALSKIQSGKGVTGSEEVEVLKSEIQMLREAEETSVTSLLRKVMTIDTKDIVLQKTTEQNEYIQRLADFVKDISEEKVKSTDSMKSEISQEMVEEAIAKVKLEYGEKIEEFSRRFVEEKNEKEKYMDLCEKKKEEIAIKETEKHLLQSSITIYEQKLIESKEVEKSLNEKYDSLNKQIADLIVQLKAKQEQNSKLRDELEALKKKMSDVTEQKDKQNSKLRDELESLKKKMTDVTEQKDKQNSKLRDELESLKKTITDVTEQKDKQNSKLRDELESLKKTITDVTEQKDKQNSKLRDELESLKKKMSDVMEEKEEQKIELVNELNSYKNKMTEAIKQKEVQNSKLVDELDLSKKQMNEIIEQKEQQNSKLVSELNSYKKKMTETTKQKEEQSLELTSYKKKMSEVIEKKEEQNLKLASEFNSYKKKIDEIIEQKEKQNKDLSNNIQEHIEKEKQLETQIEELITESTKTIQTLKSDADNTQSSLNSTIEALKSNSENTKTSLLTKIEEMKNSHNIVLTNVKAQAKATEKKLQNKITEITSKSNEIIHKFESTESVLTKQIEDLQEQLQKNETDHLEYTKSVADERAQVEIKHSKEIEQINQAHSLSLTSVIQEARKNEKEIIELQFSLTEISITNEEKMKKVREELVQIQENHIEEIENIKTAHKKEFENYQVSLQEKYNNKVKAIEEQFQEKVEQELNSKQLQFENQLELVNHEHYKKLEESAKENQMQFEEIELEYKEKEGNLLIKMQKQEEKIHELEESICHKKEKRKSKKLLNQTTITTFQNNIDTLQEQVKTLSQALQENQERETELKTEKITLQNQLDFYLEESESSQSLLRKELEASKQELEPLFNKIVRLEADVERYKNNVTEQCKDNHSLESELQKAKEANQDQAEKFQVLQEENRKLLKESESYKSQLHDLRTNYNYQIQELTKHQSFTLESVEAKHKHKINELMENHSDKLREQEEQSESQIQSMQQKLDELSANAEIYILERTKYKNECLFLASKLEDLENTRKEERKRIEERNENTQKHKDEVIAQLKAEKEESVKAFKNFQATVQDTRKAIGSWQEKVDEKKKQLESAKANLKQRDLEIAGLKEHLQSLSQVAQQEIQYKEEIKQLQQIIKTKEEKKDHSTFVIKRFEEENKKLKSELLAIRHIKDESARCVEELRTQVKALEEERSCVKLSAEKENQWQTVAMKSKAEIEKYKRQIIKLEGEKSKLNMENDILVGHTNANQKIHLHQKIKEENNMLRTNNFKLSEEIKLLKERLARSEKDAPAKSKGEKPSKYLLELEDKVRKEKAISRELTKLPELSHLFSGHSSIEPIEQIALSIDHLVQIIRTSHLSPRKL